MQEITDSVRMPRHYYLESSDTDDYSESDEDYESRFTTPGRVRRGSYTRRRQDSKPEIEIYHERPVTTASTGDRRRTRDPIIIDVQGNVRPSRQELSRDRHHRHLYAEEDENIKEIDILRSRRPSSLAYRRPPPRSPDREWKKDQLAEMRYDIELLRQQQELEHLERQLVRTRERKRENYRSPSGYDGYQDDLLSEQRRTLGRVERIKRLEEEPRFPRILERASTSKPTREEVAYLAPARDWKPKAMWDDDEAKAERERLKKALEDEAASMALEEDHKTMEWNRAEQAKKQKEVGKKETQDKELRDRLKVMGYADERIDTILKNKKRDEKKDDNQPGRKTYIRVGTV